MPLYSQAWTAELYKNLEILLNKYGKDGIVIKYKLHKDSNQSWSQVEKYDKFVIL